MMGVTTKIFLKTALVAAGSVIMTLGASGTAMAGCGHSSGHVKNTLPPLSSYFEHEAQTAHCTQSTSTHATASTLPPLSSAYSVQSSQSQSYSTTSSYAPSPSYAPLSFSVISGLGHNEGLRPTTCPVAVHNPNGGQVLGCYNVVRRVYRPVTRTTYYRVVRPIVYVRYPVPVPVCHASPCGHHHHHHGGSRYGW